MSYLLAEKKGVRAGSATGGRMIWTHTAPDPTFGYIRYDHRAAQSCVPTGMVHLSIVGFQARRPSANLESGRQSKAEVGQTVIVLGEPFIFEESEGLCVLRHRHWSLMGIGDTMGDAMSALLESAKEVAPFYTSEPDEALSSDAIEFKHFLQQHFSLNGGH